MKEKLVSIVIPSWDGSRGGKTQKLLKQLKEQSYKKKEVIVVKHVKPVGKARNIGTKKAKGDIIIYMDDDIEFGHKDVLKNLVEGINKDKKRGIVGCSYIPPKNANAFQKKIAKQSRMSVSIKKKDEETDEVCSMCFAMRKEVIKQIGFWNEKITSATDTELRFLVKKFGYKTIIPANTWIYHPPPENLKAYLRKAYWYGLGSVQVVRTNRVEIPSLGFLKDRVILFYIFFRFITIPLELFFPRARKIAEKKRITFKDFFRFDFLLALSQYYSLFGVVEGFLKKNNKKTFRRIV